jgi:hypothetical protein
VTADFDQLVDLTDVTPEVRARLLRMHEMLVAAGPPAELPAALTTPPTGLAADRKSETRLREAAAGSAKPEGAEVIAFPVRRRAGLAALIAATVAAACFGGGYVLANQTHTSAVHVVRVVQLEGQQNSEAALKVGSADGNGNWPIELTVNGLKPLSSSASYYLMVWQNGKPSRLCGTFEVAGKGSTTVSFNVAYKITKSTKWVVTEMAPGLKFPGHVVMQTS